MSTAPSRFGASARPGCRDAIVAHLPRDATIGPGLAISDIGTEGTELVCRRQVASLVSLVGATRTRQIHDARCGGLIVVDRLSDGRVGTVSRHYARP